MLKKFNHDNLFQIITFILIGRYKNVISDAYATTRLFKFIYSPSYDIAQIRKIGAPEQSIAIDEHDLR